MNMAYLPPLTADEWNAVGKLNGVGKKLRLASELANDQEPMRVRLWFNQAA